MADWTKHIERKEQEVSKVKAWLEENKKDDVIPFFVETMLMRGMIYMENQVETYKRWMKEDKEYKEREEKK